MTPLLGSARQFAALRQFLRDSDYSEATLRERMGIAALSESLKMHSSAPAGDRLDLLIHLFLLGETVDARAWIPGETLELLGALRLIEAEGERVAATVELYPAQNLYIVSDRNRGPELPASVDKVFSAITPQTEDFMATLPRTPCPSFLELCSGSGLAALDAAANYAVQSFAYDLSARSTHFAEFNRRLNRIANFTAAQGDLYSPAGRRTFDRIVAHPPYVPSLRSTLLLRDGGEVGEDLTRRIVEGLPSYLEPGGRLYCLALLAQTRGEPIPERVRRWLREAQAEFDVVVVTRKPMEPTRLIFDNWPARTAQPGDVLRWQTVLRQRRIEAFVYVTIVIARRTSDRPVVTIGCEFGARYPVDEVEALLAPRTPVLDARPSVRPGIRRLTQASLEGAMWQEGACRYEIDQPFRFAYEGPAWIGDLLAQCDGTCTVRELFTALAPAGTSLDEFARVAQALTTGGMLRP